jgi:hypothetical protein
MARVIEFYIPRGFKPMARWVPPAWKSSRVRQRYGEEVSLTCSGAKDDVRGSQARGDGAC